MKGINDYEEIETNQDKVGLEKLIQHVCHLKDDDKKDFIAAVETYKQVYLFYQPHYKSNKDDLVNLKSNSN